MASSADISVWDLWAEAAKESESLGDPVFLECLEAVTCSRFFVDLPDDKLKSSLSIINTLLNDPKTRSKGLTLLSEFLTQSNPSRLITFQDSIISALHLVVKGLESPLASNVLVCFIPKCHSMTEVNQCMTSSIIPKILAHFCENSQDSNTQKSVEELTLLRVCLEEYHGPCGQFRDKLEKLLVPLVDSDNGILLNFLGDVMPLLSYAGGGGGGGEKHTKDWSDMLTKVLKTTYSTLYALYGSSCPLLEPENPFDGEQLTGLKRIAEPQVLLRMSLLKRRLHRLLVIISAYLRMPFPAPKLVPQKGILKLITILTALNPVTTQNVRRKEDIFLSAAVPAIHSASMDVLKSLLLCVGTNIYIDAVSVEHLLTSEFKWIQERPAAYVEFKLQLYRTLASWLVTTGGVVTNLKTMSAWVDVIGNDTRVEKDVVELKILSKPKSGKSVKLMNSSSLPLGATTSLTFVQKNADVCKLALISLTLLIPSLDGPNHRKIYEHLVRTCAVINQFQTPPSPYDNAYCRKLIYENLSFVTKNPHPRSPITLSLIVSLFRKGMQDPTALVSSFCSAQLSAIERLMHPISAPLSLAGPSAVPVALDNSNINTVNIANSIASASEGSEDEEENDQIDNDKEMQIENQSHTEQSNSTGVPLLVYPDQLKQIVRDVFLESLTNGVPINVSQTPKRTPPTYSVTSDRSSGARSTFSGNNNKAAKVLTSTSPSAPSYDSDVVEVNDDSSVEAIEPSQGFITNGIRHPENELISNQTEVDDNCKRKLADDGSEYESMSNGDTQFKKTKTSSPLKSATPLEGPSVDEMLSSFIDLEPAS